MEYAALKIIETPTRWLSRSASGRATGRAIEAQRLGAMLTCIDRGHTTARSIAAALSTDWNDLAVSQATVLQRLKAMCLTGYLVPYIEPLPKDRYRFHFYRDGDDVADGLLTLDEANACADDDAEIAEWMR